VLEFDLQGRNRRFRAPGSGGFPDGTHPVASRIPSPLRSMNEPIDLQARGVDWTGSAEPEFHALRTGSDPLGRVVFFHKFQQVFMDCAETAEGQGISLFDSRFDLL
jgi:hypothetical protein